MSIGDNKTRFEQLHDFIVSKKDNEIIRATDQKLSASELKKEKNLKFDNNLDVRHIYVRTGIVSKFLQKITGSTDGAKEKQQKAKDLITNILDSLQKNLKSENVASRNAINSIKDILKQSKNDFTAGMIKEHLAVINNELETNKLTESPSNNAKSSNSSNHTNSVKNKSRKDEVTTPVKKDIPDVAIKSYQDEDDDIDDGDSAKSEADSLSDTFYEDDAGSSSESESELSFSSVNRASSTSVSDAQIEVLNKLEKSNDGSVDVNPKSGDISKSTDTAATSKATNNASPAKNNETIKGGVAEVNTSSVSTTPLVPSASSNEESNAFATTNTYIESMREDLWSTDQGYYEVSKPFHITGGVKTSKFLAQAYLLPDGKKLGFSEKNKGRFDRKTVGHVVKGEHKLRSNESSTNAKSLAHSYLKLEVKSPDIPNKENLVKTYYNSVNNISDQYKKSNPGKELTSLVIVPLTSSSGDLSDVDISALVYALKYIQYENPNLNIVISADESEHKKRIQEAYEASWKPR